MYFILNIFIGQTLNRFGYIKHTVFSFLTIASIIYKHTHMHARVRVRVLLKHLNET